ncbi:hypothetical protein [Coleofasciculus sp. H7-2]|uniref:hypothetical protein n=1 Tax=Coleofasciculus sp. H7-2 TaxID=3351545 RepID=UPI00366E7CFB
MTNLRRSTMKLEITLDLLRLFINSFAKIILELPAIRGLYVSTTVNPRFRRLPGESK